MKYIFITGGVVSSLGKGLTAGALGALLEAKGLTVSLQKMDPYLNVDPGTMSPFEHGEVYVLDDGAETDLDLGHYERFTNSHLTAQNSVSSGQIYASILEKERKGDYLGQTVQVIPHVTDEIKARIRALAQRDPVDVLVTELGGTIGDIEGLPFLEALRQFALEVGRDNILFIHVTLLPYLKAAKEMKTKPSQQSVAKLREIGIQPDILICRTEEAMSCEMKAKLSLFCNLPQEAVIEERDVETSIYELPLNLHKEKLDALVTEKLQISTTQINMDVWEEIVTRIKHPKHSLKICVVGKYTELRDAYKSVYEALTHGGIANQCHVKIIPTDAEKIEKEGVKQYLEDANGIVVPGGFGPRGSLGMIQAANYARTHNIPYLGICLGLQIAVIEYAQNQLGLKTANSTEFDPQAKDPIIDIMAEQKEILLKGATMRLGSFECTLQSGTRAYQAYEKNQIFERHRHRYEFNNKYRSILEQKDMIISGYNAKQDLVEMIEISTHPWFIGVQFHPELKSKPHCPHPLFKGFVNASIENKSSAKSIANTL